MDEETAIKYMNENAGLYFDEECVHLLTENSMKEQSLRVS